MEGEVTPVFDPVVRTLCYHPYPNHPKGCPNYGKRLTCPPLSPKLYDVYQPPFYCVYNAFDLRTHVERMFWKHPKWTNRQLRCCLYWQGTARKQLKDKVVAAFAMLRLPHYEAILCPEAMGVDVTATMKSIGIELEWPPVNIAYQVALIAERR